jgi:hypothetical protein
MRFFGFCFLALCICLGCKNKKKEKVDNSNYFPVLSFLQSEVKKIDTSLFSIIKVVTQNGVSDTTPLPRDSVRGLAGEFLSIPDLRSEKGKSYKEVTAYDTTTQLVSMTYSSEEGDVPKQQVFIVKSGLNFDDIVKTIYIEKEISNGDGLVQKRLIWDPVEHYFQIRTITPQKNGAEKVSDLKVIWEDFQSN